MPLFAAASLAVTRRMALLVAGPVTVQANEPLLGTPVAMVVYGPPTPVRDSSRSTPVTPRYRSEAFQVRLMLVPMTLTSPPFGDVTVHSGSVMSPRLSLPLPKSLFHTAPVKPSTTARCAISVLTCVGVRAPYFAMNSAAAPAE